MVFSIILTLLALSFMVIVHELGHMLVAKRFGVLVHEFSVGMGPKLFSVKRGETAYSLRLLPIGGFVQMEGEQDGKPGDPRAFSNLKWWKRLMVLAAGAIINVFVGWILFVIINMNTGVITTVVAYIPDQYAQETVFHMGDEILRVDGKRVHTGNDVNLSVGLSDGDILDVLVRRNGVKTALRAPLHDDGGRRLLGIRFNGIASPGIFTSMRYSVYDTVYMVKAVVWAVRDLIVGRQSVDTLSGPVEIVAVVDDVSHSGSEDTWLILLTIFALIAVNLGVFNLLPVPGLDGGQMLFVIIEKIIGRKIKPEVIGAINMAFFSLLIVLALFVTFGDIKGLIT
ncbi:MAG: site-2 protease family protein [Oscillospiraceae bacterium]|nr:site-2 protease family protein [Oscillospiraceae bacterium]